ncbi:MAG: ISAzo13 family transposase, partial [Isosphaeraceae bacterium]
LYYLGIVNNPARYASGIADEDRQSFGLRFFGKKNHWEWNLEDVVQVGTFGDQSILAWTASSAVRYTFDTIWQPQLGLRADIASGSRNSHGGQQETFDALYPNPEYFNNASLIRPANLIDVHPYLLAHFTRTVSANGGVDVFWRYSTSDAIYAPSGNIAIPALNTGTAYVATARIRRWWPEMGTQRCPRATELFITADGGGSNGYRTRLGRVGLQDLANEIDWKLTVSHIPPGTSKWNKVEHRLFSFITQNWRGQPLVSIQVIVHLIAATRTAKGLIVKAALDEGTYETGISVTDEPMAKLNLKPAQFHGEWNYTIRPRVKT